MTKDEKQRRITKAQMERFERSLDALQHGEEPDELHPLIAKAREDAIRSQAADLEAELAALAAIPDEDMDLSDIPEMTDFSNARRGVFVSSPNIRATPDNDSADKD